MNLRLIETTYIFLFTFNDIPYEIEVSQDLKNIYDISPKPKKNIREHFFPALRDALYTYKFED